ncbi:hypothetical protein J5Y03_00820 [Bacillus sp. RG28]|uniref:DUF3953 domain-containing protein n=1 Tax=Gottfriedia endophytica TaxID=2820819 RepID=A0A940SF90_9BACI|nr:hypothetical protein [Gottfriedia endophytica]MBP0723722.1 hypothetical protein [Gottfriedia endophytica]
MFDLLRKMFAIIGLGLTLYYYFSGKNYHFMSNPLIQLCIWLMFLMTGLSELIKKRTNMALCYFSVLGIVLIVEVISSIR